MRPARRAGAIARNGPPPPRSEADQDRPRRHDHPQAFKAAEAALCAGEQGKYWEMHDRLFANQRALAPEQLASHAQAIGADEAKFSECLQSGAKAAKVHKDLADGATVNVARALRGAVPFTAFKEAIDATLAAK